MWKDTICVVSPLQGVSQDVYDQADQKCGTLDRNN